ncbi:hypothetical protein V1227_09750 [Lentzea sp. DG1S-22]|uniref:hypothetical protein n=1 Tax=Lentzea sp. DG1S-22 TaxID=3108822 RepID=UPI002E787106|nr:hypothetical protein [Lentzea sp. DG1S-22]WVH83008.1 hypothetical protein V1227_09750 [Lentzea sp. DG1S-22]
MERVPILEIGGVLLVRVDLQDQSVVGMRSGRRDHWWDWASRSAACARPVSRRTRDGVRVSFHDEEPGISDPVPALADGWSSDSGLGLSSARRLVDQFGLDTEVCRGTVVTVVKWKRSGRRARLRTAALSREIEAREREAARCRPPVDGGYVAR